MTNSEKDSLAAEYGLNLLDRISDEQARLVTDKNILFILRGGAGERKNIRQS
jgi:hypothetical protein